MNGWVRSAVVLSVLMILGAANGYAKGDNNYDGPCGYGTGHACPANTPEISPEMGTGALMLIGVGALAIRSRRKA